MIRNLSWIALMGALALLAGWMAEHPGAVTLQWGDYQIETTAAFLAVGIILAALSLWLGFKLLAMLIFMPNRLGRARGAAAQQRGLMALTDAFVALGDQDAQTAMKHVKLAEKYLSDPTLPHLLGLQIARQQGDEFALREKFQSLQDSPQTRPLALRGLVEEARRNHHLDEAQTQSQLKELLALRPRHKPSLILAIDVFSGQRRWQEALQWVASGQKKWVLSRMEAKHLAALVYTEQAQAMIAEKNNRSAAEMLRAALKRDAGHLPAALLLAKEMIEAQQLSAATVILRKAWAASPMLELAALYEQCYPTLSPEKRLKKMQAFAKSAPASFQWEVLMAQGIAALNLGIYEKAREYLKGALGIRKTILLCQLMAELEKKENKDADKAGYWLKEAATAASDAVWRCGNCGNQPTFWQAHCGECGQFDRVEWQTPQAPLYIN